ncbi:hypothetical protein N7532_004305 [Penicillium argentinense]|uniref:Uncharacterized protein n=1 Tax=Penicillium argentinense TaxID=1131581 RepID=A0A9W9FNZ5_9EURO|nr:uncharacterized protein N7532_004305 [Penicillium argentinense]KAJ5103776.1 hypothetical protein N7532_004305 [Penicillium argentinense]
MSNLMHKVKDAVTGHHENKASYHDSSKMPGNIDDTRDTYGSSSKNEGYKQDNYNSSTMKSDTRDTYGSNIYGDNTHHKTKVDNFDNTGNAYGSSALGTADYPGSTGDYGSGEYRTDARTNKTGIMSDTYGTNTMGTTGNHGFSSYSTGTHGDSRMADTTKDPSNVHRSVNMGITGTTDKCGSSAYRDSAGRSTSNKLSDGYDSTARTGNTSSSNTYNSSTAGGYGSLNAGHRDSKMGDYDHRGGYEKATSANGSPTGSSGIYTSDYGNVSSTARNTAGMTGMKDNANLGGSHGYNTHGNTNQVASRGESEYNSRVNQEGFGGFSAGGSSYASQEPVNRRSSRSHSSKLLNKLDPRVKSSDYEASQQRGW